VREVSLYRRDTHLSVRALWKGNIRNRDRGFQSMLDEGIRFVVFFIFQGLSSFPVWGRNTVVRGWW
jgi:hypothetical protein